MCYWSRIPCRIPLLPIVRVSSKPQRDDDDDDEFDSPVWLN